MSRVRGYQAYVQAVAERRDIRSGRTSVVVVDSGALLTQGFASRLRQEGLDVEVIPARAPDMISRLRALQPRAVVVDSADIDPSDFLARATAECPGVAVVSLSVQSPNVEVLHSHLLKAPTFRNLVAIISAAASTLSKGGVNQ